MTCEICSSDGAVEAMFGDLDAAMSVFGVEMLDAMWSGDE